MTKGMKQTETKKTSKKTEKKTTKTKKKTYLEYLEEEKDKIFRRRDLKSS